MVIRTIDHLVNFPSSFLPGVALLNLINISDVQGKFGFEAVFSGVHGTLLSGPFLLGIYTDIAQLHNYTLSFDQICSQPLCFLLPSSEEDKKEHS